MFYLFKESLKKVIRLKAVKEGGNLSGSPERNIIPYKEKTKTKTKKKTITLLKNPLTCRRMELPSLKKMKTQMNDRKAPPVLQDTPYSMK